MKLVVAIVQDKDSALLSRGLVEANIRATKLASTGGFLRSGSTTFMIGVEEERVEETLEVIRLNCSKREEVMMQQAMMDTGLEGAMTFPLQIAVGGATVFVLPVDAFAQY